MSSTTGPLLDVRERVADLDDLDNIVEVAMESMQHDPQWNYRFLHRNEFWEDHIKFTRLLYQEFLSPSNDDWLVRIAVASDGELQSSRVVGFSVWNISYIKKAKFGPNYEPQSPILNVAHAGGSERRDIDPNRQSAFRTASRQAAMTSFGTYGDRQLHLQILGVHPQFWRHRVGSRLVGWGMDKAERENISLTLMAGTMGAKLYSRLGFKTLGSCIVQVHGEQEAIDCTAMAYEPQMA